MAIATPVPGEQTGGGDSGKKKKRRGILGTLSDHWIPFLTALVGLVTAALGLWAARSASDERDQLEVTVNQKSEQVDDLETTNSSLEAENTELRTENERLSTPSTTDSDVSSRPVDTEPRPVQELLRASDSPVVVPEHDGIDLDSPDSNWGVTGSSHDFGVGSGSNDLFGASGVLFAVVGGPPDVRTCEAQTVTEGFLSTPQTVVGQHLCVLSNQGRWAYVHIAAIDTENRTMSFDVTVWKLSTDP
jgi:hypothetical protein